MLEYTLSESFLDLLTALTSEIENILYDGPSVNFSARLEEVMNGHRRDPPYIRDLKQPGVVAYQYRTATSSLGVFACRTNVVLGIVSEHNNADPTLLLTPSSDPVEGVVHGIHCTYASEGHVDHVAVAEAVLPMGWSVALLEHVHDVSRSRLGTV